MLDTENLTKHHAMLNKNSAERRIALAQQRRPLTEEVPTSESDVVGVYSLPARAGEELSLNNFVLRYRSYLAPPPDVPAHVLSTGKNRIALLCNSC
jgi:hypothetical protein